MSSDSIKIALRNFGLTQKESQIYIFLAKYGPQGGGEIVDKTKTANSVTYRILKILQQKGFIESTLESPTRYAAIPFEDIIDSVIKSKKEEATLIEEAKVDLISDWEKISQSTRAHKESIEKFSVIDGKKKILNKISQMLMETQNQFLVISEVSDLLKAEQFGIFENFNNHPLRSNIKFHFITQIPKEELHHAKFLKRKMQTKSNLKGRTPNLGSPIFQKMVLSDDNEILLFITDKNDKSPSSQRETVLSTNCRSIIKSFSHFFEDLWNKSSDIEKRISELETGKPLPKEEFIEDPKIAQKTYFDALNQAKKEIMIVTGSRGIVKLASSSDLLKSWCNKGVSLKILAPITNEALNAAQRLMKFAEVKHIPVGYTVMTIIDDQKLFQFNDIAQTQNSNSEIWTWKHVFFTNNKDYVLQSKSLLFDVWSKTHIPLSLLTESPNLTRDSKEVITSDKPFEGLLNKRKANFQLNDDCLHKIKEKDVLEKINSIKKNKSKQGNIIWTDDIAFFGKAALAVIDLPIEFNIPKFLIAVVKHDDDSTFGAENALMIQLWTESSTGSSYVPVAYIVDNNNPDSIKYRKKLFEGFPIGKNIQIVEKEQLQVLVQGTTFFAGWTNPISLHDPKFSLPPCCLLFEGFGNLKSGVIENMHSSGRKQELWHNSHDAFVTFFHPKSNYMGSGTEGIIDVESAVLSSLPKSN